MKTHPTNKTLMIYADDPSAVKNRAGVAAHLKACTECSTTVEEYRTIATAQQEPDIWLMASELLTGAKLQQIAEFEALMRTEDEEAKVILTPFLESVYAFSLFTLEKKKEAFSGGVVRLLCAAARDQCDRQPRFAVALAETATAIADALPDDLYPSRAVFEVRGLAWKDYSTALRYVGRFDDCWQALDLAEEAYRQLVGGGSAGTDLAAVALGRASMLFKQERYAEALRHARKASEAFADFHDQIHYFEAKHVEANILQMMGDAKGAASVYKAMLQQADAVGDADMKARAAHNLGVVYVGKGQIDQAASYFSTALKIVEKLHLPVRVARTRWGLGSVSLAAGRYLEAAQQLTAARAELFSLGMMSDGHVAGLDLAEALVVLGHWKEVQVLCTQMATFFRTAAMINGSLMAASYMKEAATARTLTRRQIGHVREYLQAVERRPSLIFVPPPPER